MANDNKKEISKMDERIKKQIEFALEIDKEKNIFRQTHLTNHGRNENDAEHAWHLAIMAYLLKEYSNENIDIARVMIMCLIHDIVEIDAGDTYAYDEEGLKTQKAREEKAKERIFSILPLDQKNDFIAIFDEFEETRATLLASFENIIDTIQSSNKKGMSGQVSMFDLGSSEDNNIDDIKEHVDVIIDFSIPVATFNILEYAIKNNTPIVIATTGFSADEEEKIKEYSKRIPIFKSSNMSFDIMIMKKVVKYLAPILKDADIEITEVHHNR